MNIEVHHTSIGAIQFRDEASTAERTVDGFVIDLPVTIRLRPTPEKGLIPMLSGLRGRLFLKDDVGGDSQLEIGRFQSDQVYHGGSNDHEFPAFVEWRGSAASLVAYERLRDGRPPVWHARIAGEIHLLSSIPNEPLQLRNAPQTFWGQEELRIATEVWATMLQRLGVMDFLLVQFPIPEETSGPMMPIWTSLRLAREDFQAGGESGWRSCGIHLRQALTDWQAAVPLDTGKGVTNRAQLTKEQRLDNFRQVLRDFTHVAGHQEPAIAKAWTRDDALLALSVLCALLNARKP